MIVSFIFSIIDSGATFTKMALQGASREALRPIRRSLRAQWGENLPLPFAIKVQKGALSHE
jgi:hypothetical protein